jgi:hypothetical protein
MQQPRRCTMPRCHDGVARCGQRARRLPWGEAARGVLMRSWPFFLSRCTPLCTLAVFRELGAAEVVARGRNSRDIVHAQSVDLLSRIHPATHTQFTLVDGRRGAGGLGLPPWRSRSVCRPAQPGRAARTACPRHRVGEIAGDASWPRAAGRLCAVHAVQRCGHRVSLIHFSEPAGTAWPSGLLRVRLEISKSYLYSAKTVWAGSSAWLRKWSGRRPGNRFLLTIPECMHIDSRCGGERRSAIDARCTCTDC